MSEQAVAEGFPKFKDLSVGQVFRFVNNRLNPVAMCKVGPHSYGPLEGLFAQGTLRYSQVRSVSDIASPVTIQ